jgi:hypothetical protein
MPSFKTSPELDSSARSPYDDLNRLEQRNDRNGDRKDDRNGDRNPERNGNGNQSAERNLARQLDTVDERNAADLRAQERLERVLERASERNGNGGSDREADRKQDRESDREPERATAPLKAATPSPRKQAESTHPLIEGLFSKLPQPEAEWSLAARQKWLQTAASIFDLMYTTSDADAGELTVRAERNSSR